MEKFKSKNQEKLHQDARASRNGDFSHLPEKTHIESADYRWLNLTDADDLSRRLSPEEAAERYIKANAYAVAVFEGTARPSESQDMEFFKPDAVIAFEKSARPAVGAVRLQFKDFARKDSKMPPVSFLNIDRADLYNFFESVVSKDGRFLKETYLGVNQNNYEIHAEAGQLAKPGDFERYVHDREKNNPEFAQKWRELKAAVRAQYLFGDVEISPDEDYLEKIEKSPTKLDGKNVLLFDEVVRSGSTFDMGEFLIKSAIPEIKDFARHSYWGRPIAATGHISEKSGEISEFKMGGVPIWYDSSTSDGRGISDADDFYHAAKYEKNPTSRNFKHKLGAKILSTPRYRHVEGDKIYEYTADKKFVEIMRDFHQLRKDYRDGKIEFRGVPYWSDERFDEFLDSKNKKAE